MEVIRKAVRSVIGCDSRLYRIGARTLDFMSIVSKDGIGTWRVLNDLKDSSRIGQPPSAVKLKNLLHPILMRPGTDDVNTVVNNVVREEYGNFSVTVAPEWMIDAGAFIGDTSAYFLSRFPKLKVVALEPDPRNYEMAQRNLECYGVRTFLLNKGLFSSEQIQYFSGAETGAAITTSGIEIECTTLPLLLDRYAIERIDILKMDIEGAEEAIFSANPGAWLHRVALFIIEIHGSRIELPILNLLKHNGFSVKKYRSLWYCRQEHL